MDYFKAHEISKKRIQQGIKSITNEENNFVRKVYKNLTGKPWRGCTDCWGKLYIETSMKLMETSTNKIKTMLFKLKPKKIIHIHGFSPVGEKNMTDEIAMKILQLHKGHIKNFASYPENWENIVDGFVPAPVKPSPSEPKTVEVSQQVDEVVEDSKEEIKKQLEEHSKKELIKICESYQYPEKEYSKLNKEKLVDYILTKQF